MGFTLAPRYRGQYRVIYPDGETSIGMTLEVANSYQRLFGGRVVRDYAISKSQFAF